MKLRNKETGEIIENACIGIFKHKSSGDCERVDTEARSLEKVLDEWEDYIPAKPLIEDEAKRSVFKAWAEILGRDLEKADFKYDAERNGFDCYLAESIIEFANGEGINCVDREIYTFRALCGEEEE